MIDDTEDSRNWERTAYNYITVILDLERETMRHEGHVVIDTCSETKLFLLYMLKRFFGRVQF